MVRRFNNSWLVNRFDTRSEAGACAHRDASLSSVAGFGTSWSQLRNNVIVRIATLLLVYAGLNGCATVTRGTEEAFTVNSSPQGATAKFSSGQFCETPCTLMLKRKRGFTVTVEKDCYETVITHVQSQIAGAGAVGMAGNVIIGGIIGAGVDIATGATKELVPNPLHIELEQGGECHSGKAAEAVAQRSRTAEPEENVNNDDYFANEKQRPNLDSQEGCNPPQTPSSLENNPDRSRLLDRHRELALYNDESKAYRSCLMDLARSPNTTSREKDLLIAEHNAALTIEEALAKEYNNALDHYDEQLTDVVDTGD